MTASDSDGQHLFQVHVDADTYTEYAAEYIQTQLTDLTGRQLPVRQGSTNTEDGPR